MSWTEQQWSMFTAILSRGFAARDPFTEQDSDVYRLLLDGVEPEAALTAVREIVLEGKALRPKPGEIVARAKRDSSKPTFEEAYRLIFGPGGVLAARPSVTRWRDEGHRRALCNEAAARRAEALHPLVGSFVARQGLDRLRELPVDDPDYGEMRRRDLREAWERHVDASDGREVTALAAGTGRTGLRQLDPLTALGLTQDETPAIEAGDRS